MAERASRTDLCITVMAILGVTALTALGWVLSYTALRDLAPSAGMATWAAMLWPRCVDAFVFVATLAAIAHRRCGRSTTYGWTLAMAYSAATVAGNMAVAGTDCVAQAVHATPAVKMVLAWHLPSRFFEGSPAVIRSESAFLRRGVKPMLGDLSRAGHQDARMAGAGLESGRMSPRWPASQDAQRPAGRPGEDCRWV